MTWPLMERPARNSGEVGGEGLCGFDGGAGGLEEDFERVDEVFGVAGLEAVAVGVVVAEGGDAVVGEGLGHVVHEGGAHGGAGAVAEEHEGDGVVGLEEEGGDVGGGRRRADVGMGDLHCGGVCVGFQWRRGPVCRWSLALVSRTPAVWAEKGFPKNRRWVR